MTCSAPALDLIQCSNEFADFYSKAILTTSGVVNYYRFHFGGNTTFFAMCGETFSSPWSLTGTDDVLATAMYPRHADTDGRLVYDPSEDHSIYRVDLDAQSKIQAVAVPGVSYLIDVALNDLGVPGAGVGSGSFYGFGYVLTFGVGPIAERIFRWDRTADETGGTATAWLTLPTGFHTGWEYITQTYDGRVWVGGIVADAGTVQCYDTSGAFVFEYAIPTANTSASIQISRWRDDVIAFYQDGISNEGVLLRICADGSVVDFTSTVTIDGVPFSSYVASHSYRPKLHTKGDAVVFVDGNRKVFTGMMSALGRIFVGTVVVQ